MTTSEGVRKTPEKLVAFARAEAELRYPPRTIRLFHDSFDDSAGAREAFSAGFLRAVELLQSEEAVREVGAELEVMRLPDSHTLDDRLLAASQWYRSKYAAERVLTAAVGAVTRNQETGGSST